MALSDDSLRDQLTAIRAGLDKIDEKLIELFAQRFLLGLDAAKIKSALGMPMHDPAREEHALENARRWARRANLPESEVEEIFRRLISLSRRQQESRRH